MQISKMSEDQLHPSIRLRIDHALSNVVAAYIH